MNRYSAEIVNIISNFAVSPITTRLVVETVERDRIADAVDKEGDKLYPPMIVVHTPHIQQQTGNNDCGLFALLHCVHKQKGEENIGTKIDKFAQQSGTRGIDLTHTFSVYD